MPKFITADEAAALIPDGATVMFGGFIGCGSALDVIEAIRKRGTQNIQGIFNDTGALNGPDGESHYGNAKLIHSGQIKSYIGTHVATTPEASELWSQGKLKAELVPQGSFVEMIRAGGYGLGGIITPTGVGTLIEESPLTEGKITIDGKDFLIMKALTADFAVVYGTKVDKNGNVWYKGMTANFNVSMAFAGKTVILEAEELVECGEIEPENVKVPGICIDYVVLRGGVKNEKSTK